MGMGAEANDNGTASADAGKPLKRELGKQLEIGIRPELGNVENLL